MPNIDRTFHFRVTWLNITSCLIVILLAFYFFWNYTVWNVIIGLTLLVLASVMMDRILHTEYIITSKDELIIKRGRLSKPQSIKIEEIISIKKLTVRIPKMSYILIEYGYKGQVAVEPQNEEKFIEEITLRQSFLDKEN